jgi:hypothetical protein
MRSYIKGVVFFLLVIAYFDDIISNCA